MKTNIHFLLYFSHFFLERDIFEIKVAQKIKTHIIYLFSNFLRKSCHLWDKLEKYCTAG
jgi:hypothetical protein